MDCQKVVSVLCAHCKNRCDEYYSQIKNKKSGISYIENVHVAKRTVNRISGCATNRSSGCTVQKISVDINAR